MTEQNNILINKLDEFIRKYYKNQLVKGALYSTALLVSAFLVVVLLEFLGEFNTAIRSLLFYAFLATSIFVLIKFVFIPLSKLNRYGKVISYEEAATIIGTHFTNVQDKLLNVLQLQSEKKLSGSNELLMASIQQKVNELKPVPFTSAINISENKKYLKYVLPPLFLTLAVAIIWPNIITKSTTRLVHHQTYFESEAPFQFNIENSQLKAVQQQDFVLHLKITGSEIPNEVFISIDGNEFKLEKENNINFNYTFKNVQANTPFVLTAAGYNSKSYELEVLPKPSLMQFNVHLKYPAYLNRKDENITNSGDLQVPQGTRIDWEFNTKNTDNLVVGFSDTTLNAGRTSENKFSFTKSLFRSTSYYIKTQNHFVTSSGDSVNYGINVIADQSPYIDVSDKVDSLNPKNIYFSGSIKDDYGFTRLVFKYTHYTSDSLGNSKQGSGETVLGLNKNQISQPYYHYFDASRFDIKPGDKIDYYFEVWDNDGVNGAKPAKTKVMQFKAPTVDEINEATEKNNDEIKKDLDESIKKAKELQKDINELTRKMNEKKQLGWEEKKKLEDLLNKQKSLEKKVDEIKQENQLNNQQQNQYSQQDESILEKQKQLEKLFENVMTPEMKKMFNELQKLMEQLDKNQIQQKLEDMKMTNKDIEKELDRALETFKQFEVEQKLQQSIDKLDELIKKEEQLNKDTEKKKDTKENASDKKDDLKNKDEKNKDNKNADDKNKDEKNDSKNDDNKNQEGKDTKENKDNKEGKDSKESKEGNDEKKKDANELKKEQDDIKKEFEKLQEDLKELEKKNAELEQPNQMPDTKQQQQEAGQEMQNSSEELSKDNKKNASKSQKNAQKKMEDMKNQMQMSMDQMQEKEEEENASSLRQILENLLNLSFAQEELIKTLPKTRVDNPQFVKIPQQQKKLQDDAKVIEDSLLALSKRAPQIEALVNREISAINNNMKKTIESLAERMSADAGMRMQSSMTSINNLALLLNESLEQMQKQMQMKNQMKASGGGKCKNPKNSGQGQKPKSGQPSMSQMQQKLNQQLQQLKDALEKGQKPGEKPGQKPGQKPGNNMGQGQPNPNGMNMMPGNSEQLAKMAAQQEALRRQLQQMMDQMKNKGQNPGGNLADMMEQTEKDIVNKQITNETMKRQQEILTRLLESEKAEKEREQDEKRKSNEAKNQELSNPSQFLEYKRMKERELELLNTVPPSLTPYYKEKVNNYFNSVSK